jgi:hypothetical protein
MQHAMRSEIGKCDDLPKKLGCELVIINYCTVRKTVVKCCNVAPL